MALSDVSILSVVNHYIDKVTPIGNSEYQCLCPFHNDNNPSMSVSEAKGLYHCFSCKAGGGVLKFVMDIENVSPAEAVVLISQITGLPLEDGGESTMNSMMIDREKKKELELILNAASMFFRDQLSKNPRAGVARSYLMSREVSPTIASDFRLGYAPPSGPRDGSLLGNLTAMGFLLQDVIGAGLAVNSSHGLTASSVSADSESEPISVAYDRFRDKLVFPIFGSTGRGKAAVGSVIGFGARELRPQQGMKNRPKYVNSPESLVFHKRTSLFGMQIARAAASAEGVMLIVEGYFDVISLHSIGIKNVVAVMGSSVSKEQLVLASRCSSKKTLVLMLDADDAGVAAMLRTITQVVPKLSGDLLDIRVADFRALARNLTVSSKETAEVALVKDPADLVTALLSSVGAAGARQAVQTLVQAAPNCHEWAMDELMADFEHQPDAGTFSRAVAKVRDHLRSLSAAGYVDSDRMFLVAYCAEKLSRGSPAVRLQLEVDLARSVVSRSARLKEFRPVDADTAENVPEPVRTVDSQALGRSNTSDRGEDSGTVDPKVSEAPAFVPRSKRLRVSVATKAPESKELGPSSSVTSPTPQPETLSTNLLKVRQAEKFLLSAARIPSRRGVVITALQSMAQLEGQPADWQYVWSCPEHKSLWQSLFDAGSDRSLYSLIGSSEEVGPQLSAQEDEEPNESGRLLEDRTEKQILFSIQAAVQVLSESLYEQILAAVLRKAESANSEALEADVERLVRLRVAVREQIDRLPQMYQSEVVDEKIADRIASLIESSWQRVDTSDSANEGPNAGKNDLENNSFNFQFDLDDEAFRDKVMTEEEKKEAEEEERMLAEKARLDQLKVIREVEVAEKRSKDSGFKRRVSEQRSESE